MNRRLIVRLRNWVGDVTLGVPALMHLAAAGFELHLLGRGWARELLAGHGWPVEVLGADWRARVAQLARLRREAEAGEPGFRGRINALCLPYSFSSALEFRLAGLRAVGHAYEGRSLLLARARPRPRGVHELEVYCDLAAALAGPVPVPTRIGLQVSTRHREQAAALLAQQGIRPGFIVICPFAGGTWAKQDKTWPGFATFAREELPRAGRDVIVCPAPGAEESLAQAHFGSARLLAGVNLGVYAALLERAALMLSNDTGPGHIAAAVGAPLVSVLGPSDPALWRAWGPTVRVVQGETGWPEPGAVAAAVRDALAA